jgi:nucleoprotein TPR
MRGGPSGGRGRGGIQPYQARGGAQAGRGRGGNAQRGGLNATAQPYSPTGPATGPAGVKRAREDGSMVGLPQGNNNKRARGGGQN